MNRIRTVTLAMVILSMPCVISAVSDTGSSVSQTSTQPKARFRYAIVENGLLHNGRLVFVLMDASSFSEANLRDLFQMLSKRFPEPNQFWVAVCTNLQQVPTPEEMDYLRGHPDDESLLKSLNLDKYPSAEYTRSGEDQYFEYSRGDGQQKVTVVLAGKKKD